MSRFGRIRRWRMQRAIGVLKPWWGPRIDLAHARLNAHPYRQDRDSGYRMGVYSTLRDLVMLNEGHPAYEIDPRYGLIGVPAERAEGSGDGYHDSAVTADAPQLDPQAIGPERLRP